MKNILFLILILISFLKVNAQTFSSPDINTIYYPKYQKNNNNFTFTLTHSFSQIINPNTSVSCNTNGIHHENSYYRVFDLYGSHFNLNSDWSIQEVQFGIGIAQAGIDTLQDIKLVLYIMSSYDGKTINPDSLSQKGDTISFKVNNNETGTIKTINIQPAESIPFGNVLVVEILVPDGSLNGNKFFIGSNDYGETDNTYIKASHCRIDAPIDVADLLYPDMNLVLNIRGAYNAATPEILQFTIDGQYGETKILNNPEYTVNLVLPADTVLTNLTPSIVVPAGFFVSPASGNEIDFSLGAVEYTVSNELGKIAQTWQVNVKNAGPDIYKLEVTGQEGETIINFDNHTISVKMPSGTDLTGISPKIYVYDGFTVSPASESSQDFSGGPVHYTVTQESLPLTQDWQVSITNIAKKFSFNPGFNIYPNPVYETLHISGADYNRIEIADISGIRVLSTLKPDINISNFRKGIYFLRIYYDGGIYVEKIVLM